MGVEVGELIEGLRRGERRALARLLTVVEDGDPAQLREVVSAIFPSTGRARVLGVTGSPGVGKSTLTDAIATQLRARDRSVGILAVDPTSPFSGGALLGDRVRMQGHHADPHVFIRSMASRGHLGGLSFATPQAILLLDAAGFDDVIIETVGVGQSEVEIAATADTTIVALAPGMGDGVQAAKAGILEVADVFVINKADRGGAGQLESELQGMLEMGHAVEGMIDRSGLPDPWWPPIVRTVAVRGEGIEELVTVLDDHTSHLQVHERRVRRQRDRAVHMIREIALEAVRQRFSTLDVDGDDLVDGLAAEVAARDLDPYTAADRLLDALEGTD